jgi:hypothetical protein
MDEIIKFSRFYYLPVLLFVLVTIRHCSSISPNFNSLLTEQVSLAAALVIFISAATSTIRIKQIVVLSSFSRQIPGDTFKLYHNRFHSLFPILY